MHNAPNDQVCVLRPLPFVHLVKVTVAWLFTKEVLLSLAMNKLELLKGVAFQTLQGQGGWVRGSTQYVDIRRCTCRRTCLLPHANQSSVHRIRAA